MVGTISLLVKSYNIKLMVDTKLTDHKHHTFMDTCKIELIYCKYHNNTIYEILGYS